MYILYSLLCLPDYLNMDFIRTDWIDEEMKNVFKEPEKNSGFTGENISFWNRLEVTLFLRFVLPETEFPLKSILTDSEFS